MEGTLDLREQSTEIRTHIFEVIDSREQGDHLGIVASQDVDPHLVRYQIERDRNLEWEYAHPDGEPRELEVAIGAPLEGYGTIDVRDLKPQRRHNVLLTIFDELGADEGFVLVNDHDPKPLYHELKSMHGEVVDWEYRSRGSDGWRVEVVKTDESEADDGDVVTSYDVRDIPKAERHPTIHHRYGMIPEGGTMELIAPHEPRPLHREFREKYGDSFDWEVLESGRGRVRVHITKEDEGGQADHESAGPTTTGRDEESMDVVEELDVRHLPPAQRHERIFDAYEGLATGEGFLLVNDHDPKPLYHQFDAEAGPEFRWEYRQRDPGEFHVLIGKAETTETTESATVNSDTPF